MWWYVDTDDDDNSWECAGDVAQKGGGGNADSHSYDNVTVVLL